MKISNRLTTLAITAFALAGTLGAQQRTNNHAAARSQPARSQSARSQPARSQPARSYADSRPRQGGRPQQYASARADNRGRNDMQARMDSRGRTGFDARSDSRGRNGFDPRSDARGRNDFDARSDFRGRDDRRVPVADHGRPLITRAGVAGGRAFGREAAYGGVRYGAGFNRFGGRLVLPFGWDSRVVFHGYFPAAYGSYCEAVPMDYNYMLPPMQPSYDPCLFGDRVIVYDRFSRSIVFVATL
jgi:hypothetical protein